MCSRVLKNVFVELITIANLPDLRIIYPKGLLYIPLYSHEILRGPPTLLHFAHARRLTAVQAQK